jgi:hypothetical protein
MGFFAWFFKKRNKTVPHCTDKIYARDIVLAFKGINIEGKDSVLEENINTISTLLKQGVQKNELKILKLFLDSFKRSLSDSVDEKTGAYYFACLYELLISEGMNEIMKDVKYYSDASCLNDRAVLEIFTLMLSVSKLTWNAITFKYLPKCERVRLYSLFLNPIEYHINELEDVKPDMEKLKTLRKKMMDIFDFRLTHWQLLSNAKIQSQVSTMTNDILEYANKNIDINDLNKDLTLEDCEILANFCDFQELADKNQKYEWDFADDDISEGKISDLPKEKEVKFMEKLQQGLQSDVGLKK